MNAIRFCANCDNTRWVCENHQNTPWEGARACPCSGAGAPCPITTIPRGKYVDQSFREPLKDKSEHFIKCEICGGWIDMRDLGSVMDHAGPLPHPVDDMPQ